MADGADCEIVPENTTPGEIKCTCGGCMHKLFIHRPTDADRDHGSAWLVMIWSCISHALHLGFLLAVYGTVSLQLEEEFDMTVSESSLVCSANNGVLFVFSVFVSALLKKTTPRIIQFVGGVCMIIGIGGLAFAHEKWAVYLLFTIISGIGCSCCYMATTDVLVHHFEKRRYLAFSVVRLGYFAGVMIFPVVSQYLFDAVGFHVTMGILGCFMVLHLVGAAFFTSRRRPASEGCCAGAICCKNTDESSMRSSEISVEEKKESKSTSSEESSSIESTEQPNLHVDHIGFLPGLKKLLSSKKVWCLLANNLLWSFNVGGFLIFINGYMVEYVGLTADEAALGVTILGVCNIVGTLIAMATSTFDFDRLIVHAVLNAAFGAATIVIVFSNGKVMFYIFGGIWGLAQGTHLANIVSVCYDFCGVKFLTILFSLNLFAEGLGGLPTGPLIGYLQTNVHPKSGISLAGASGIMSCVVLIPVIIHKYIQKRKAGSMDLETPVTDGSQEQIVDGIVNEASSADAIDVHSNHTHKEHPEKIGEDEAKLEEINPGFEEEEEVKKRYI